MINAPARTLWRYAALGIPLAFAGLPIYVHVPKFYAELPAMNLALLGVLLLALRLVDCFIDPWLGSLRDRFPAWRQRMLWGSAPVLMLGYALVFHPPASASGLGLALWLGVSLMLVYASFSVLMLGYYANGLQYGEDETGAARVAAYREGAMLVGVLLASVLPVFLAPPTGGAPYSAMSIIFAGVMLFGAAMTLRLPAAPDTLAPPAMRRHLLQDIMACWRAPGLRYVLVLLLVNSVPTAITGTLFFFFCQDVLRVDDTQAGLFLLTYFVAAAAAVPLWLWLSKRIGLRYTLACGMGLAIASFLFAYTLGPGDVTAFFIICVISGAASGADAALMPALFADRLKHSQAPAGMGFGLWHFMGKLTLALAAGITLPLLAVAGYAPGGEASINALSLAYALLPCILKLFAMVALLKLDPNRKARTP